jgi:hypothetical protein
VTFRKSKLSKECGVSQSKMKGLIATVPPPNPTAIRCLDAQPSSHPVTSNSVTERHLQGRTFSPCALGLLALAIAIALWGFGYKLSRYDPHPSAASRASIAKLWDKRPGSLTTDALSLRLRSHLSSWPQPFWISIQPHGKEASAVLELDPRDKRASSVFRSLNPSRSPPYLPSRG